MIETVLTDLRYGAKMLWKSKGVTIVAVVSQRDRGTAGARSAHRLLHSGAQSDRSGSERSVKIRVKSASSAA